MNKTIKIQCENCSKNNEILLLDNLKCQYCEEEIIGKHYIKKPFIKIPITLALISGITTGVILDETLESDRFPMQVEHSILEACIHGDNRVRYKYEVKEKRKICVCALEGTLSEINYSEFEKETYRFHNIFSKQISECK